MDASEKIIRFPSYEAMLDEIKRDMVDNDPLRCRYPVRFIMLNNFDIWHDLVWDLAYLGVQPLNLEELIEDNHERWITTDELCNTINGCKITTVITPFSELVRFYSEADFKGIFNEIMLTEDIDHPRKRIYIPLIGLQNRFGRFLAGFARIEESAPVWAYLIEEHKTKVFLTTIKNERMPFAADKNIKCIDTLYDWLRFWKKAPQKQIICSSGPINRREKYSDPDNIFTFEPIKDSREYLESFLGVVIPFKYDETEEKYGLQLLADIIEYNPTSFNFFTFVSSRFGFTNVVARELFFHWAQTDTTPYYRWMLKNFFLSSTEADKYPYLTICFKEISAYENHCELFSKIAERIFYFSDPAIQMKYASERETLIRRLPDLFINLNTESSKNYIKDCILEISKKNIQLAMALSTGVFDFEKILLIMWYADRDNTGLKTEKVAEKFPYLWMYLSDIKPSEKKKENWHLDYLDAYREAKISDMLTEKISSYISKKNHDGDSFFGWYYSFNETHDLLCRHKSSTYLCPDKVYWIDALGAEFLPFMLSFFEKNSNSYRVIYSEITRCTIPSATAQNRFDDAFKYGELDKIAHDSSGYKKGETLVRELQALATIMQNILDENVNEEHTITIVSDHGLSCLSRLSDSKKYDAKVEHDGRYIKVADNCKAYHDADYVVHNNENDENCYKVALTHSSLGHKPIHEVHGGCTPEEVLVPYIIITNKKQNLINYKYELITKEINESDPIISINVMPQPSKVKLYINDKEYDMTRSGSKWSTKVDCLKEGEYKAEFAIPGGISFNTTIQVNGTGFDGNNFLDF